MLIYYLFFTVLEICNGDYGDHVSKLVKAIENGKNNCWRSPANDDFSKMKAMIDANLMTPIAAPNLPSPKKPVQNRMKGKNYALHATSFWRQLYILLKRNAIKLSRDRVNIII